MAVFVLDTFLDAFAHPFMSLGKLAFIGKNFKNLEKKLKGSIFSDFCLSLADGPVTLSEI